MFHSRAGRHLVQVAEHGVVAVEREQLLLIRRCRSSSQIARGYVMSVQSPSPMLLIAVLGAGLTLAVMKYRTFTRRPAAITSWL